MSRLRVYMLPDYRQHNPYQALLSEALAVHGVDVTFPSGYRLGLPASRGVASDMGRRTDAVLHLHWPEAYLTGSTLESRALRAARLWIDVTLAKRACRGFVWTLHNLAPHEHEVARPAPRLCRRLAGLADALIVHGDDARTHATDTLRSGPAKVSVIPQAHYADKYGSLPPRAEARARLGLEPQHQVFLLVGMLRPYKGLDRLLDAWAAADVPNATLLIAGLAIDQDFGAHLRERIERLSNVRLDDKFVADEDMTDYLAVANIGVFPFERVSNSGGLLLALGYNLPVVAPALPAVKEAVGAEYPLLYEPNDTVALTKALQMGHSGWAH